MLLVRTEKLPEGQDWLYDAEAGRGAISATHRNDEVGLSPGVLRSSSRAARSQRRYTGPEVSCRTHRAKPLGFSFVLTTSPFSDVIERSPALAAATVCVTPGRSLHTIITVSVGPTRRIAWIPAGVSRTMPAKVRSFTTSINVSSAFMAGLSLPFESRRP